MALKWALLLMGMLCLSTSLGTNTGRNTVHTASNYEELQVVRLSIRSKDRELSDRIFTRLRSIEPFTVQAWGEHDSPSLDETTLVDVMLSRAQLAEARTFKDQGLKAAVVVENLPELLEQLQNQELQEPDPPKEEVRERGLMMHAASWYATYRSFDQIAQRARQLEEEFPSLCVASNLSASLTAEGRSIPTLRLKGTGKAAGAGTKVKVVLVGLQHAREWISAMVPILVAEMMLKRYGVDEDVTFAMDNMELVVVPVLNPDGYAYTRAPDGGACTPELTRQGLCDRLWRKNRTPSRSMGDLFPECVGVDLNRNWPLDWGTRGGESVGDSPCEGIYPGTQPLSETESWSLNRLMEQEQFTALVDLHAYKQLVLSPWAHADKAPPHAQQLDRMGRTFAAAMSNNGALFDYARSNANGELYYASGTLSDWAYGGHGMLSFTVEMRPLASIPGFFLEPHLISTSGEETLQGLLGLTRQLVDADWKHVNVTALQEAEECPSPTRLSVVYTPDLYPAETTWHLMEVATKKMLQADDDSNLSYKLCSAGEYMFEVWDAFGDGMCCDEHRGSLYLQQDEVTVWALPDDFQDSARFTVTVANTSTTTTSTAAESHVIQPLTDAPFQAPNAVPASSSGQMDVLLGVLISGVVSALAILCTVLLMRCCGKSSKTCDTPLRRRAFNQQQQHVHQFSDSIRASSAWGEPAPKGSRTSKGRAQTSSGRSDSSASSDNDELVEYITVPDMLRRSATEIKTNEVDFAASSSQKHSPWAVLDDHDDDVASSEVDRTVLDVEDVDGGDEGSRTQGRKDSHVLQIKDTI
eukprot:CAMPEP_0114245908 /NCGR_PEP_ID=MMETSP0058-20121206/12163_1 /TAXON_ID=36894 /ORGANISM="Pyramimonas parkeae, CCMP726" /LENGTH=809 /DNA_ID=CAMNT_0001359025 /DNA_START=981 /DNA_END=3410 /DNA_ORIENTATION=-